MSSNIIANSIFAQSFRHRGTASIWVKGDMIYSVGFHRLNLIRLGKQRDGKRIYRMDTITGEQMKQVKCCVLRGLGMSVLTKHL
jgi:mRNA interferase MazF